MYRMVQDVQDGPGCTEGCSASYLILLTKRGFFRETLGQIRNLAADWFSRFVEDTGQRTGARVLVTKENFEEAQ